MEAIINTKLSLFHAGPVGESTIADVTATAWMSQIPRVIGVFICATGFARIKQAKLPDTWFQCQTGIRSTEEIPFPADFLCLLGASILQQGSSTCSLRSRPCKFCSSCCQINIRSTRVKFPSFCWRSAQDLSITWS